MSIEAEQRPCCGCAYGVLATCLVMPHAPCPHPYPTLARYRWVLVPACCLLHGCIMGDVPLLSSGEANFKYHKHNSTLKGPLSGHRRLRLLRARLVALGDWLGVLLCGDERLYRAIHTHSLATYFYLLTTHSPYLLTYSQAPPRGGPLLSGDPQDPSPLCQHAAH